MTRTPTERQKQVLDIVSRNPHWTVKQIAARLGTSRIAAHMLIRRLIEKGALRRRPRWEIVQ
jgi:DNA-binding MarR family transcriptional regulator